MMNCDHLHEVLDDYLRSTLSDDQLPAIESHLADCAECRGVVSLLQASGDRPIADDLVVRPVLAATTGRSCTRVQEVLAGDPEAGPQDQEWVGEHVHGCTTCEDVARVLEELPAILPTFASLDPGPDFTAEVLLATLPQPSLWSVFMTRMRDHLRSWQRRPEFAQEFSFALTIALVLLTALPASPLRELPRQALSIVQVATAGEQPEPETGGTVGGQLRQGLRVRGERLGAGFDRLGTHVLGAGRGLVDGDLGEVGENAGQIGCDLQRLWEGVRAPAVDPETVCG